ncbi:MAG: orotate phosphoribosyltransferase [Pseudomonadales bacterium]
MLPYQEQFIRFAIEHEVLQFGDFTLKSGRQSPYFFNAGKFNSGAALQKLGGFYADALANANVAYDMLFGPAYKGIPLVAATAIAANANLGRDLPFAFNRKEVKDHGEGGQIVGAELTGRVVVVDDVITAGTAIREVMSLLEDTAAQAVAVVVAIDREEKGSGDLSAIQEIRAEYAIEVVSVVNLSHIVSYLEGSSEHAETLEQMRSYQESYGI